MFMFESGWIGRYKRFTVFLTLILLLSTLVAVFHHLKNTADDHDCLICIVSNHQSETSTSTAAFGIAPYSTETIVVIYVPSLTENLLVVSQAPQIAKVCTNRRTI